MLLCQRSGNMKRKSILYIFGFIGILLFIAGAAVSGLVIKEQPQVLGLSAQSEITVLISKVGKLIVLPSDESPTITTITDVSKLSDQSFFRNAKNKDKFLIYTNAKWAVLYRPSENRIIEVGTYPLAVVSPTPLPSASPTPSPSPSPVPSPSPSSSPSVSPSPSLVPSPSPKI